MKTAYAPPVDQLLTYGDCRDSFREWPDYLKLGLTKEHIPELIGMATDEELHWADSERLEVWAPVHAWRALGQLRAEEAIEPLMRLFHELEDSDWVVEELPQVYAMIGPKAIPALRGYLSDSAHEVYPRVTAAQCLERIGNTHPQARAQCIEALTEQLERFTKNDPTLNAFLISFLVDLKAVESIPSIRRAFEANDVDFGIMGDLEDVEMELGLRAHRSGPPQYKTWIEVPRKPKMGRNDPCPCGSGKKYKKCCMNKGI